LHFVSTLQLSIKLKKYQPETSFTSTERIYFCFDETFFWKPSEELFLGYSHY